MPDLNADVVEIILILVGLLLSFMILVNTLVIIVAISAISFFLVKISGQFESFDDVKQSLAELTKVVEQQSRLLEYMGRRGET